MEKKTVTYDVLVCGGGLAGVCTAISASRAGAKVALIQDRPVLGGNSSSECGVPPHGAGALGHCREARETGIIEELRLEYAARSGQADNRQFWDLLLKEWCDREPYLDLYLNTKAVAAHTEDSKIQSVGAIQLTTETRFHFRAQVFVDATGDGFLSAEAGAVFRMGREPRSEFGESLAPDLGDANTLASTLYFVVYKRDHEVPFVPPDWAYKYEDCSKLPFRPHNIDVIRPGNSVSADNSSYRLFWWLARGGDEHTIKDSEKIYDELVKEMLGVWDHLKNHCDRETGDALSTYDLVWWALFPIKRESRRVEGDYILTEQDVLYPQLFSDRVAYGGWPIDNHPPEGIRSTEPPCDQTFLNALFSIPYRCLYARDIQNLFLAGRCMSASHVAMGSMRVMCTLAAMGQAIGTASAMCLEYNTSPRGIWKDHIEELQQRLIRDDAYIIKLRNNDASDLARQACITTTSSAHLAADETDGYLELKYELAQQVPISDSPVKEVSVFLRSILSTEATVEVVFYAVSSIGHLSENAEVVGQHELSVQPKQSGWVSILTDLEVKQGSLLWISISKYPGVFWGYSKRETFGTRFAVHYKKPLIPASFHGRVRIAPQESDWVVANHNGRLPEELHSWLEEVIGISGALGTMVHGTLNVRLLPVQKPYEGPNVISGIARAEDWPNMWMSDPEEKFPQPLTLSWDNERIVRRVLLTFDTRLDAPERVFGWPREEFRFPFPVPECVRDYEIAARLGGQWEMMFDISGNYQRRRTHEFPAAVKTDAVRITVKATNGSPTARIYEIRIY